MASDNETVADILAEMFDFSDKRIEEGRDHAMTSESVGLIVHQLARRFEAAWKRESVGNSAAMREALVKIRRELNDYCNDCTLLDRMTEAPPDYTCLRDSLLEIERIVNAALSKPPRNCDRFASIDEARLAYCSECGRIISIWDGDDSWLFESWLFAPATERKGDGDAI